MSATQFSLFLPQVPNGYYLPNTPCGNLQRRGRGNCISPAHCKGSLLAIVTNCCPPIVLIQPSTPQPLNPSNPWVGHTCLLLFEKLTFNAFAYFQGTEYISLFGKGNKVSLWKESTLRCCKLFSIIFGGTLRYSWSNFSWQTNSTLGWVLGHFYLIAGILNCNELRLCTYWSQGERYVEWPFVIHRNWRHCRSGRRRRGRRHHNQIPSWWCMSALHVG